MLATLFAILYWLSLTGLCVSHLVCYSLMVIFDRVVLTPCLLFFTDYLRQGCVLATLFAILYWLSLTGLCVSHLVCYSLLLIFDKVVFSPCLLFFTDYL